MLKYLLFLVNINRCVRLYWILLIHRKNIHQFYVVMQISSNVIQDEISTPLVQSHLILPSRNYFLCRIKNLALEQFSAYYDTDILNTMIQLHLLYDLTIQLFENNVIFRSINDITFCDVNVHYHVTMVTLTFARRSRRLTVLLSEFTPTYNICEFS